MLQEKKAEEARRLSIKKEKIESVHKVPEEPDSSHPDVVHVVFKLPCGSRLDRRFLKTHSLEVINADRSRNRTLDITRLSSVSARVLFRILPSGSARFIRDHDELPEKSVALQAEQLPGIDHDTRTGRLENAGGTVCERPGRLKSYNGHFIVVLLGYALISHTYLCNLVLIIV